MTYFAVDKHQQAIIKIRTMVGYLLFRCCLYAFWIS